MAALKALCRIRHSREGTVQHDLASATVAKADATDDLLIEMRGSLAIVTLNRPRALNAMTVAMRRKLAEALGQP